MTVKQVHICIYLGTNIHDAGSRLEEAKWHIAVTNNAWEHLTRVALEHCCRDQSLSVQCIHPTIAIILFRDLASTADIDRWIDTSDQWCLRKILLVWFICPKRASETKLDKLWLQILQRQWRLFDHVAKSDPNEDHASTQWACINQPPKD